MSTELPSTPQPSGTDLLVAWANEQDHWIRQLVADVIETRRRLSDERIETLCEVLLREKGLADGDRVNVAPLTSTGPGDSTGKTLRIVSLKHVENVNALVPNQEIEFHPRLTICFGENASGKTGYVRILKRAAGVRTAEQVLPNIRAGAVNATPRAEIRVAVDDAETAIEWRGEAGVEPLTRLDIFDARAAVVHVAEDLSYSYTPADLSLFPLVADGIDRVQAKLQSARDSRQPGTNPFLARFGRQTPFYVKIEELGPTTDLRELEALADVSQAEEAELPNLRDQVEALRSGTVRHEIAHAEEERLTFDEAHHIAETIAGFDRVAYQEALSAFRSAREAHEKATRQALASESVPGILGDAWRAFVEAAEAYIQETGLDPYPRPGEPCLYCRQPLEAAAVELLQKYREYCNNALRRAVEDAQRRLYEITAPIRELPLDELKARVERLLQVLEHPPNLPTPLATATELLYHALRMQDALTTEADCPQLPEALASAATTLAAAKESVETTLQDLRKQGEERERVLAEKEARLRELEARLTLRSLMPAIRTFVENARWVERARTHLDRFRGIKRSLTETAKRASSEVMNRAFAERFEAECELLRAPHVNLDFPGREGEAKRRKLITAGHGLDEILSEGEQKVIALADFLAEAALKPDRSPIVFDDPVTSLDHKRLQHVVDRVIELCQDRQVIVFTHDIWFAAELLARFEHTPGECSFYDVRTENNCIGLVTRGSNPRTDTFSDRRKRINNFIKQAERETGATRDALVEKGYEELRGACEIVVEKDLLKGVTERYRPNVRMTVLDQIRADRLPAAIGKIMPIFEKCCRIIASHSQPTGTLGVRPTLEELQADWQALQQARQEYLQ